MTAAMGLALAAAMASGSVLRRLEPTGFRVITGLAAGVVLYGLTWAAVALLRSGWPGWEAHARLLYAIRGTHGWAFVAPSLVLIVLAEEAVWRGVIARFLMERWGRAAGIVAGAAIYALAHAATLNPLLVAAALGCGLFWGVLYAATDSLVAPLVSHLVWDILLLFVLPIAQ
jgi:membrane protease YdiL (CAAX protease family)